MSDTNGTRLQTLSDNETTNPVVPVVDTMPSADTQTIQTTKLDTSATPHVKNQENTQQSDSAKFFQEQSLLLCNHLRTSPDKQIDVYLMWYERRWEEIHYRNEIKHKIASAAFITLAALVGAYGQMNIPTTIFFVYPLLTLFLSGEWAYFNRQVDLNGWFIRRIEKVLEPVLGEGWEVFWPKRAKSLIKNRLTRKHGWFTPLVGAFLIDKLRASSIFIGAPLLALTLGLIRSHHTFRHWYDWWPILLCLTSVLCSFCMIIGSEVHREINADISNLLTGDTSHSEPIA